MTKKDFQFIADTIGDLPFTREARLVTGGFFATSLKRANPRFALEKFEQALIKRIDANELK